MAGLDVFNCPSIYEPYFQNEKVTLFNQPMDKIIQDIPEENVDLVLTDPPYGITGNAWDKSKLIALYVQDLIRKYKTVVLTAGEPFAALLITHNLKYFKHEWIWVKNKGSNFGSVRYSPMKEHEKVLVFSRTTLKYNPQMQKRSEGAKRRIGTPVWFHSKSTNYGMNKKMPPKTISELRVPSSVQYFDVERGLHPTQKPLDLFEYLIKTYSDEKDTVLDPFCGSGTTLVSALNLDRKAIGIEKERKYCDIAVRRIKSASEGE